MALKTYRLEVDTQEQVDALEFLTKKSVVKGKNLVDAVSEFAINYYNRHSEKGPTLVTEAELIRIAREAGLTTGKASIVQYRRKGVLQDKKGKRWYFQNDQHKVIYNLEKMMEFLKMRHQSPKSHIKRSLALAE